MKSIILGICGRAGSGKSSVARYLVKEYGAQKLSFAEPLKRMAIDIWGFSEAQVFGEAQVKEAVDPRWHISPLEAMQKLGEAARMWLWPTVWIDKAFENADREPARLYVIDDVRYRNEAAALVKRGSYLIRLHCTDSISKDKGCHPSEHEVDLISKECIWREFVSSNEQGLEHLFGLVDAAMIELHAKRRDVSW